MTDEWIKAAEKEAQQQSWDFSNMEILLKLQSFVIKEFNEGSIKLGDLVSYSQGALLNRLTKHFFKELE